MKNFHAFLSSRLINKIILSHDAGIIGNALPKQILTELKELKKKSLYLGNLYSYGYSQETIDFLDGFLSDVQEARAGKDASVYAQNFVALYY